MDYYFLSHLTKQNNTMGTLYNSQYSVGHYDAPPRDEPATLPVMIRGEFICSSMLSACETAVECARADITKMADDEKAAETVDAADETPLDSITKGGYYLRWLPDMDDFPKVEETEEEETDR